MRSFGRSNKSVTHDELPGLRPRGKWAQRPRRPRPRRVPPPSLAPSLSFLPQGESTSLGLFRFSRILLWSNAKLLSSYSRRTQRQRGSLRASKKARRRGHHRSFRGWRRLGPLLVPDRLCIHGDLCNLLPRFSGAQQNSMLQQRHLLELLL